MTDTVGLSQPVAVGMLKRVQHDGYGGTGQVCLYRDAETSSA